MCNKIIVVWFSARADICLLFTESTPTLEAHSTWCFYVDSAAGARVLDCIWNVMAHAQKPDFVFRRNGRVHLNRRGRQFNSLLAVDVCASAVLVLDTPCSEVVWRVLATHSIRQLPLHFPSRAAPCAITFKLDSTTHIDLLWLRMHGAVLPFPHKSSWHSANFSTGKACFVAWCLCDCCMLFCTSAKQAAPEPLHLYFMCHIDKYSHWDHLIFYFRVVK